ncbi:MAG TPA: hypothetical protein VJ019_03530 [Aestuariivirga sp.]|nr:hypothetical protein [Aestuariivirga sp.]
MKILVELKQDLFFARAGSTAIDRIVDAAGVTHQRPGKVLAPSDFQSQPVYHGVYIDP